MPRLSLEALLGLLLGIAVPFLDHLHVRDPVIVWGLFVLALAFISDSIIRSEAPTNRKAIGMVVTMAAFLVQSGC